MVRARHRLGPAYLVVVYLLTMPLLAGLPRGRHLPVVRPSEALQLTLTASALVLATVAVIGGARWEVRVRRHEWWLAAMVVTGSLVPVLWLVARSEPLTTDGLMAAFPLIKYGALYVLVRTCVTTSSQVRAVALGSAVVAVTLSFLAVAQALQLGPTAELIGRYFVSSIEDVADGGRATTTIGSSIATGAFLALAFAVCLSRALITGCRRWSAVAGVLVLGALASGQAGTVVALVVVLATAARAQGGPRGLSVKPLVPLTVPGLIVAAAVLWPVVLERLDDVDPVTGVPKSWLVRWNNIDELFLPSLLDWGWLLGVNPDTEQVPPDLWRESVYLESGYLWLLWVGGIPLLVAALGFLFSTFAMASTGGAADRFDDPDGWRATMKTATRAGVAMMLVLSVIDPHLTLRAGADLFFVLVALASTGGGPTRPVPAAAPVWRMMLGADEDRGGRPGPAVPRPASSRLQLSEAPEPAPSGETAVRLDVVDAGVVTASARLVARLDGPRTRGRLAGVVADGGRSFQLLMRAVALVADSLDLDRLVLGRPPAVGTSPDGQRDDTLDRLSGDRPAGLPAGLSFDRTEIAWAATVARRLERARTGPDGPSRSASTTTVGAVRLDVGPGIPRWKRALDLGIASAAVLITAPLWLVIALAIRRSDPGPVLFRQLRVGLGGLPFVVRKFRTMYVGNDDSAHRRQNELEMAGRAEGYKDGDDPRITPVGRWLRRLSLDELPQLVNVLRGEMSLVGPRPSLLWEVELFPPPTRRRLSVPPGITGLWQVGGRAELSLPEMLELDVRYVDDLSPGTDLRCLVRTAGAVVGGEGAT